jgi:hypothetical protein
LNKQHNSEQETVLQERLGARDWSESDELADQNDNRENDRGNQRDNGPDSAQTVWAPPEQETLISLH